MGQLGQDPALRPATHAASGLQLLKLVQSRVQVGIPLPWNVLNSEGKLLLARGKVILDETQLSALLDRGAYVDAEEVRAAAQRAAATPLVTPRLPPSLFALWSQAAIRLATLLPSAGKSPDFLDNLRRLASDILALVDSDADVGIYASVRQERNQHFYYGHTHAVHTAMAGALMGRRLGWARPQLLRLALAALTMNITIVELQGRMAAQHVPMLDRQREQIRRHPQAAAELLAACGVTDEEWLTAVVQHHERPDGSGYPAGRTGSVALAQALHLADTFMASISPRVIRAPLSIQEAARNIFRQDGGGPLATAIVKEFGIYPPGDLVRLRSGETAVVVRRSASATAPLVAAITDRSGLPVTHTTRRDTAQAEFAIVGVVADKTLVARLPPERLYGVTRLQAPGDAMEMRPSLPSSGTDFAPLIDRAAGTDASHAAADQSAA